MDFDLTYDDYCWEHGPGLQWWKPIGWRQKDLTVRQSYNDDYLRKYRDIDAKVCELARRRVEILTAMLPSRGRLLDYGCGTGRVVEAASVAGWISWGFDLTAGAPNERRLRDTQISGIDWDCVTFFDSLEHVQDPVGLIRDLKSRAVMISVPCCHHPSSPGWFMAWKHRRPGEHLWHWNQAMLDRMMATLNYVPVMHSNFEDDWRRNKPDEQNILTVIYRKKNGLAQAK